MQRLSRNEGWEVPSPQLQRNRSFSSDRNSMPASLASPPSITPDPAYIAAAAASQIITSDHQSRIDDWFDENGGKIDAETAVASPASITLVNSFLDHLLFSILSCARSTAIVALRPAVAEVLKPRLAKDAIDGADEELQEFLGGGDDEDLSIFHDGLESRGKWDLNLAWRRTRLRCMVFTRLGDMEEDDEEIYIERERMEEADEDHARSSRDLDIISPAAAIFLTSILEFIGEHALMIAGEAAFNRREIRQLRHEIDPPSDAERVVVDDIDMEKLAFNTTLGRLWRSWKKQVRAPSISHSRPISRDFMRRRAASLSGSPSVSELGDSNHDVDQIPRSSVAETLREEQETNPSAVPSNDGQPDSRATPVELAQTTASEIAGVKGRSGNRPRSMLLYPQPVDIIPLIDVIGTHQRNDAGQSGSELIVSKRRQRSSSLPDLELSPHLHSLQEQFFTPMERPEPLLQPVHQPETDENDSWLEDGPSPMVEDDADPSRAHLDGEPRTQSKTLDFSDNLGPVPVELSSHSKSAYLPPSSNIPSSESPQLISASQNAEAGQPPSISRKEATREGSDLRMSPKIDAAQATKGDRVDYPLPTSSNPEVITLVEKKTQASRNNVAPKNLAMMQGGTIGASTELAPGIEGPTLGKRNATIFHEVASIPQRDPDSRELTRPRYDVATRDVRLSPTRANGSSSGSEHGTPLTPLRESVEAAHDDSDDSSSLAPSQEVSQSETLIPTEPTQFDGPPSPASTSSASFLPSSHALGGNKAPEKRKDLPPANTAGAERAAVQRITPPPGHARDGFAPLTRTSTSSNRPLTAATAASGTSQLSQKIKTLIGRESTEGSRVVVSKRTSSEGSEIVSDSQSANTPKEFDKQQSFEQLIKSEETIQYTLTPKNMRDMEGTVSKPSSPGFREVTEVSRNGDFAEPDSARQATGRTIVSLKGSNGLRSNPPEYSNRQDSASNQPPPSQSDKGQSHTSSISLTSRSSPIIPRDARPKIETTAAIADFIRTTGPEHEPESPTVLSPGVVSRPNKAPNSASRTNPASQPNRPRKISKSTPLILPKSITTSPSTKSTSPSPSKKPISKLQAREAIVIHDEKTSDLIDFIRQGPAYDRGDGNHRISRAVAPFRTTMDSDEIQALGNGKGKDTLDASSSIASTQDSLAPVKSTHSSSNSRTALIDNANRSKVKKGSALGSSRPPRPDDPPHPIRKQRRDKDPYGIDTESEGDDEYAITPRPERQEEYLIDFLRSITPPPPKPIVPSAFDGIQKPNRSTVQKKSSGPNMRGRFAQNGSAPSSLQKPASGQTQEPAVREVRKTDAGQQHLAPREVSPHLITQVGSKFDTYKPTRPTYAAHIDRERKGARRPRQLPRAERESDSAMSELVDFFKNSAPPPTPPPTKPPPVARVAKEESGFSKIFSRKKRMTGRA